jgi:hypothetical protein
MVFGITWIAFLRMQQQVSRSMRMTRKAVAAVLHCLLTFTRYTRARTMRLSHLHFAAATHQRRRARSNRTSPLPLPPCVCVARLEMQTVSSTPRYAIVVNPQVHPLRRLIFCNRGKHIGLPSTAHVSPIHGLRHFVLQGMVAYSNYKI